MIFVVVFFVGPLQQHDGLVFENLVQVWVVSSLLVTFRSPERNSVHDFVVYGSVIQVLFVRGHLVNQFGLLFLLNSS